MAQKTLLIIEDHTAMRRLVGRMLTTAGYQVHEAIDGMSGVYLAHEIHPDLVLLDLLLPDIPGTEVAALLAGQPFIVLTSDPDAEKYQTCLSRGALGYVLKPPEPDAFLKTIGLALERSRDQDNLRRGLRDTRAIAKAIGIIMAYHKLNEAQALRVMQRNAVVQQCKTLEVAAQVIEAMNSLVEEPAGNHQGSKRSEARRTLAAIRRSALEENTAG